MTRVGGRAMVEKKQQNRVDDHPNAWGLDGCGAEDQEEAEQDPY